MTDPIRTARDLLPCGCVPDASGYGYCGRCTDELHKKIWKGLTPKQRAFDRCIDPIGSADLDDMCRLQDSCSCHINPPCNYCINLEEDDE